MLVQNTVRVAIFAISVDELVMTKLHCKVTWLDMLITTLPTQTLSVSYVVRLFFRNGICDIIAHGCIRLMAELTFAIIAEKPLALNAALGTIFLSMK
nr:unnamed protein product [Callosobruchus analis]